MDEHAVGLKRGGAVLLAGMGNIISRWTDISGSRTLK